LPFYWRRKSKDRQTGSSTELAEVSLPDVGRPTPY
jgi:hypothetical protein